jgi:hypothetical protein
MVESFSLRSVTRLTRLRPPQILTRRATPPPATMAASGTKRGTVGRGEERYAKAELIERFGPNAAAPDVREAQAIRRSGRRGYGLGHAADGTWRMGIKGALAGGGLPGTGFNGHQEFQIRRPFGRGSAVKNT